MKKLIQQLVLFGVVGVVTLIIDTSVTYMLYNFVHLQAFLASGVGFLSGFFFNFPMNRKRVFNHSTDDRFSLRTQIALYAALSAFNLIATSAAVAGLVNLNLLKIQHAKIIITAACAVWNFLAFRLVIFSNK